MEHSSPETDPSIFGICHKREVALQITGKRRDYSLNGTGAPRYAGRQNGSYILLQTTHKISLNVKGKP